MDYEFSEIAKNDLDNLLSYFSEKLLNKQAAVNFWEKIHDVLEDLLKFPEMYEVLENDFLEFKNIRRVPIDNFNLYYLYNKQKEKIVICRILYARKNLESSTEMN